MQKEREFVKREYMVAQKMGTNQRQRAKPLLTYRPHEPLINQASTWPMKKGFQIS